MTDPRHEHKNWKEIVWMGSSRDNLRSFPKDARVTVGQALVYAQAGSQHRDTKPLRGNLRDVIEIIADSHGQAFRATYVTTLGDVLYVLHAFNKKSTKGRVTPKRDIHTIDSRLRAAREHHEKDVKR